MLESDKLIKRSLIKVYILICVKSFVWAACNNSHKVEKLENKNSKDKPNAKA